MNFKEAIEATTRIERDSLIKSEIQDHFWEEDLEEFVSHGGWPDDAMVYKLTICDSDEGEINVNLELSFNESVPTGCKDFNQTYPGSATVKLSIDRTTGDFDIELDGHVSTMDDFDQAEDDLEDGKWPYFLPDDGPEEF